MIESIGIINRQVSKKLGVSEELVKTINEYFWKEGVKTSMRSGLYTAIRLPKLGTFVVSRNKLNKRIQKYISYIRFLSEDTSIEYKRITKEQKIATYVNDLKLLLDRRNDIAKIYKMFSDERRSKTVLKTDLG